MDRENRFKMLTKTKPEDAKRLSQEAQKDVDTRWQMYQYLAAFKKEYEVRIKKPIDLSLCGVFMDRGDF
jgi:hypothetical protein